MHVAIIGNGVTGVSAALRIRAREPDWRITLISGESTYHYSRPALMYVFMGHMRYQDTKPYEDSFWREQRLDLVRGWVTGVDLERRELALHDAPPIHFDRLLLATGSRSNRFGWPGQDLDGVQGLYGLADLKRLYDTIGRTRRAVIVGGGLIGIELAEMLHSAGVEVTFLVRERSYWDNVLPDEESQLVNEAIRAEGLGLELETELASIEDDGRGRCAAAVTGDGRRFPCELVGLTAGVSPNVELVRDTALEVGRGILVDDSLRTSVEGVYAAGDCAEIRRPEGSRNLIQQVWYTGKKQGEVVGDVICGEERTYDPGIWFNSAKFLHVEYQTYGRVGLDVPGEASLFWRHPSEPVCVRLVHVDGAVVGFNVMGTRWRHEVCERWLAERLDVRDVIARLEEVHFDPEFYRRHEPAVRRAFQEQLS